MPRIAVVGSGAAVTGEFRRRGSADLDLLWLTGGNSPGRGVARHRLLNEAAALAALRRETAAAFPVANLA